MEDKKIVVVGSSGQLAQAFKRVLPPTAVFLSRNELDLGNTQDIVPVLTQLKPNIVICAAAYTQVDLAESHQEEADRVNALAPHEIAKACATLDAILVHFSTDYVFDGKSNTPYTEDDKPSPLNVYGCSKLKGERLVAETWSKHLIFRVTWLYSEEGKNFLNTMLRLGADKESLRIVDDQIGSPTYVLDVAKSVASILQKEKIPWGTYHLTNSGQASWYMFACEIFSIARKKGLELKVKDVEPIQSKDFPTPAKRPALSLLDNRKYEHNFNHSMRPWREALEDCLQMKKM